MSNLELIKQLRSLTQAGMKDCQDSLEESGWDLNKAVDIIKTKGLAIANSRSGKIPAEGMVSTSGVYFSDWLEHKSPHNGVSPNSAINFKHTLFIAEVNCETDFVASNPDFIDFNYHVHDALAAYAVGGSVIPDDAFDRGEKYSTVHRNARLELISKVKENVVVRRHSFLRTKDPLVEGFSYTHSNKKLSVILQLRGSNIQSTDNPAFKQLGEDLAMQIAAMNPLAISKDKLLLEDVERQRNIFATQVAELNKPQAALSKILDGKFAKWHTEVCLLDQECITSPKKSVQQHIEDVECKVGGKIEVVDFIRYEVGEGLEKKSSDLAGEVSKMM